MHVELKDVSKRFGAVLALDGISLEIGSGERVALVGSNGSGKSTLVRATMGMLRCEGTVRLDGQNPFLHRNRLASHLAYVPQIPPQLGATVGEITGAVAALRGLNVEDIHTVGARLDLELTAVRRRPVRELSGGMRQKLLIALAMAAPASLFIMDEPTASLDHESRESFYRMFFERASGATLLLCSHRLDDLRRLVDRVVVLEEGRVALDAEVTAPEIAEALNEGTWWNGPAPASGCGSERRAS